MVFIFDTMETFDRWWQSKWKYLYWGRINKEQQLRDSTQQNYLSLVSLEFENVIKKTKCRCGLYRYLLKVLCLYRTLTDKLKQEQQI